LNFSLPHSIEILERTPYVLQTLLKDLSPEWTMHNEGGDTWCVYDVIGHLIHGENTDWMTRLEIFLSDKTERKDKTFKPFDRFAQFEESKGKTLQQLLDEFTVVRTKNLKKLVSLNLSEKDFKRTAFHPTFGEVSLSHLLSTWAAHDLGHIGQIVRVMAKQYKEAVGPWIEYMRILQD
jgi:uncharacterized damage-inducible protein DinB